ncbi:MAG: TRAP transporter small permease [Fusobacteriaceae bacterium]|jgi:TRAP-type C4-dicarboxylate transport system permease small subunit|nr:TRAP transporter small permease [Fusobacteriaceae bacterium]
MNQFIDGFTKFMDFIYRILVEFSKCLVAAIAILISLQVIFRKFFFSIKWSEEMALVFIMWLTFISMAIGVEKKLHIAIEVFYAKFSPSMKVFVDKAIDVLVILLGGLMVIFGITLIMSTSNSTLPATKFPAAISYVTIPIGGLFMIYFSFLYLFNLKKYKHKNIGGYEDEIGEDEMVKEPIKE